MIKMEKDTKTHIAENKMSVERKEMSYTFPLNILAILTQIDEHLEKEESEILK